MNMGRGGSRDGAGRPSKWNSGKTEVVRVPEVLVPALLEIAKYLDEEFLVMSNATDETKPEYVFEKKTHLNFGGTSLTVWYCPALKVYRQQEVKRKGWEIMQTIYYFDSGENEPVWEKWSEIRAEAEYRLCCVGD